MLHCEKPVFCSKTRRERGSMTVSVICAGSGLRMSRPHARVVFRSSLCSSPRILEKERDYSQPSQCI